MQVLASGETTTLTSVDPEAAETDHWWPEVLPNGKGVLFTAWSGSEESSRIAVVSLQTGHVTYLLPSGSNPHYSSTGHIVYGVDGALWAVGFDADQLTRTNGDPVPVVENVLTGMSGAVGFDLSDNGSLVLTTGGATGGPQRTLVWVDRDGREEPIALAPAEYIWAHVSPDGSRVAVSFTNDEGQDVWVSELSRGTLSRVTTHSEIDKDPVWTPDGQGLVFPSHRAGARIGFYLKAADGTGLEGCGWHRSSAAAPDE